MRDTTERPEGVVAKTSILVEQKLKRSLNDRKITHRRVIYNEISIKNFTRWKGLQRISNFLLEKISE